jgi:hypothetical protein
LFNTKEFLDLFCFELSERDQKKEENRGQRRKDGIDQDDLFG